MQKCVTKIKSGRNQLHGQLFSVAERDRNLRIKLHVVAQLEHLDRWAEILEDCLDVHSQVGESQNAAPPGYDRFEIRLMSVPGERD